MAWTNVQHATSTPFSSDPETVAFGSNVVSGNVIALYYTYGNGSGTTTFSKSSGTATIGACTTVKEVHDTTNGQSSAIGWCLVTGSGSLTMQGSAGGVAAAFSELQISEFSGNDGSVAGDGNNGQATTGTNPNSGNFTTSVNGDLIFAGANNSGGGGTVSKGSSFTLIAGPIGANQTITEWKTQASAGSTNADFNDTANEAIIIIGMALTPAASAATRVPYQPYYQAIVTQ